jgi:hypothetical protein
MTSGTKKGIFEIRLIKGILYQTLPDKVLNKKRAFLIFRPLNGILDQTLSGEESLEEELRNPEDFPYTTWPICAFDIVIRYSTCSLYKNGNMWCDHTEQASTVFRIGMIQIRKYSELLSESHLSKYSEVCQEAL